MGLFDRFSKVVQANVHELLQGDDPERLLDAAIHEMQKELGQARVRLNEADAQARARREMVEARLAEVARFEKQAKDAEAEGLHESANDFRTFMQKAKTSAQTLESDAVKAEQSARELKDAIDGLEKTIEDARAKRTEVSARLKDLRQHAGPRISQQASEPTPPPRERARTIDEEFRNIEHKEAVDAKLEELKRKMREPK